MNSFNRSHQRGATLIIAVILLLLMTVFSLFALNVGIFEQRTSANDYRSRMVNKAAELAMSQGLEYFNINRDLWDVENGLWTPCDDTDESFPCGSVPRTIMFQGAPIQYRSTMFAYTGGTQDIDGVGGVDDLESRMAPLDRRVLTTTGDANGFAIRYGAGALLCKIEEQTAPPRPLPVGWIAPAARCTTGNNTSQIQVLTTVARAQIPGERASATVMQGFGIAPLLANAPGAPPIVSSGTVNGVGNFQIVTNPNSGGPGVPVSIWSRLGVAANGTPNTCYSEEFFRSGGSDTIFEPGTNNKVIVCDNCNCPSDGSLSFDKTGGGQRGEGIDILDFDGNLGENRDVRPEEFPCDLFAYVFGVDAWRNDLDVADNFCETRIKVEDPENSGVQIGVDELFLRENAVEIIDDTADCGKLDTTAAGLYWVRVDCTLGAVGTATAPVVLVVDNAARLGAGLRVFGLMFVRALEDEMVPATGGSAELIGNANGVFYGAIVVQGTVTRLNGTGSVVYIKEVLDALADNNPQLMPGLALPGSWTDSRTY